MAKLGHIVVVGASLAGLRMLQALRRLGFDGRLTAVGEEPHPPYDRPPLSKQVLTEDWPPDRTALLRDEDTALDIDWRLGARACGLEPGERKLKLESGEHIGFDACAITTGALARRIPNTPDIKGIHTLRNLDDALAIRALLKGSPRVAVVGGGFVGAEVAASCRARGLEVTMVEALPAPLERGLGRRMGMYMAELHRDHGVELRLGVGVKEFIGDTQVAGLRLSDGAHIPAELVVIGIGATPATDWLEGSGLELDDGVLCDEMCRARRAPFVVAAGDVARWPNRRFGEVMRVEHWTNATEQADHAAAQLLAGSAAREPFTPVPFVWSDQFDYKLQFCGRFTPEDESVVVDGSLAERRFVMLFGNKGQVRGVLGINRPRLVMKYRGLIRRGLSFADAKRPSR